MEEYYKWRIEQLEATVAKQEQIINQLINNKALKHNSQDNDIQ
jgi:uncharacterized coiled-coil protein SlyX